MTPGIDGLDRRVCRRLRILGPVSILVFFVPLVAPLVQAITLGDALLAAWRGTADRLSVALAAAGAALGFALLLATEYLWVV
ncbi:MAG TPA: hypothetical protein VJ144_05570 [Candidatus Polarisedimenticolia bacterium]|nr:hypothetical protein [Candidatus Polarisedimenticolia bacterium]